MQPVLEGQCHAALRFDKAARRSPSAGDAPCCGHYICSPPGGRAWCNPRGRRCSRQVCWSACARWRVGAPVIRLGKSASRRPRHPGTWYRLFPLPSAAVEASLARSRRPRFRCEIPSCDQPVAQFFLVVRISPATPCRWPQSARLACRGGSTRSASCKDKSQIGQVAVEGSIRSNSRLAHAGRPRIRPFILVRAAGGGCGQAALTTPGCINLLRL